jgi:hypothetical protein
MATTWPSPKLRRVARRAREMVQGATFEPTEDQRRTVRAMAGFGVPQDGIAVLLDVDPKTLRRHFRRELDRGSIEATAKVAQTLFGMATVDKNVAAAIFWMKVRPGWRERCQELDSSARAAEESRKLFGKFVKQSLAQLAPEQMTPMSIMQIYFEAAIKADDFTLALSATEKRAPYVHARPLPQAGAAGEPITIIGGLPDDPLPDPDPAAPPA